jgi:hypothetical protein
LSSKSVGGVWPDPRGKPGPSASASCRFTVPETTRVSVRKSLFERRFCRRVCVWRTENDLLRVKGPGWSWRSECGHCPPKARVTCSRSPRHRLTADATTENNFTRAINASKPYPASPPTPQWRHAVGCQRGWRNECLQGAETTGLRTGKFVSRAEIGGETNVQA